MTDERTNTATKQTTSEATTSGPMLPGCTLVDGDTDAQLRNMLQAGCATLQTAAGARVVLQPGENVTIPAATTLRLEEGASWLLGDDASVLVEGPYELPMVREQFFFGKGRIARAPSSVSPLGGDNGTTCAPPSRIAYPEWFGAKVDDQVDDAPAIARALALGDAIDLAAGRYQVAHRILLDRHQTLRGAGMSVTRINQAADASIVQYATDPADPNYADWRAYLLQDFIVGLASDCATVHDLSIIGSDLPDDLSGLSNVKAALNTDPLVSGIQISSSMRWRLGDPPIQNIEVRDVEIYRAASNCINIQSDRAATDVTIRGVRCEARQTRSNTSGLTIEAFHPTYANKFERIAVYDSSFRGGTWGLYIAGVTDFSFINSTVEMGPGATNAALFYTSDNGHPITAKVRGSRLSLMTPWASSRAVVELAGRGYVKDVAGSFPFMQATESSLVMEDSIIESSEYKSANPSAAMIPLLWDVIGMREPVAITRTEFRGGSVGITGGDPLNDAVFGAVVYDRVAEVERDLTLAEIESLSAYHSNFVVSLAQFRGQAGSAIRLNRGALQVYDTTFYNVGTQPVTANLPIVDLGAPSPFHPMRNAFAFNGFSGVNANSFLRIRSNVLSESTTYGTNNAFATAQSRRPETMETILLAP